MKELAKKIRHAISQIVVLHFMILTPLHAQEEYSPLQQLEDQIVQMYYSNEVNNSNFDSVLSRLAAEQGINRVSADDRFRILSTIFQNTHRVHTPYSGDKPEITVYADLTQLGFPTQALLRVTKNLTSLKKEKDGSSKQILAYLNSLDNQLLNAAINSGLLQGLRLDGNDVLSLGFKTVQTKEKFEDFLANNREELAKQPQHLATIFAKIKQLGLSNFSRSAVCEIQLLLRSSLLEFSGQAETKAQSKVEDLSSAKKAIDFQISNIQSFNAYASSFGDSAQCYFPGVEMDLSSLVTLTNDLLMQHFQIRTPKQLEPTVLLNAEASCSKSEFERWKKDFLSSYNTSLAFSSSGYTDKSQCSLFVKIRKSWKKEMRVVEVSFWAGSNRTYKVYEVLNEKVLEKLKSLQLSP